MNHYHFTFLFFAALTITETALSAVEETSTRLPCHPWGHQPMCSCTCTCDAPHCKYPSSSDAPSQLPTSSPSNRSVPTEIPTTEPQVQTNFPTTEILSFPSRPPARSKTAKPTKAETHSMPPHWQHATLNENSTIPSK